MSIRRWLFAGSALAFATTGSSVLVATGAQAGTANSDSAHAAGAAATPSGISGPKYDFCDREGCPVTTWKIDFTTHKFKGFHDPGTFTNTGNTYAFTIPNIEGSGVTCTFKGTKNAAGFNSAAKPGHYTCTDGTRSMWWATLVS
jgi:hypothetical protein